MSSQPAGRITPHVISGTPSCSVPAHGWTTLPAASNVNGGELVVSSGFAPGLPSSCAIRFSSQPGAKALCESISRWYFSPS